MHVDGSGQLLLSSHLVKAMPRYEQLGFQDTEAVALLLVLMVGEKGED